MQVELSKRKLDLIQQHEACWAKDEQLLEKEEECKAIEHLFKHKEEDHKAREHFSTYGILLQCLET